MGLCLEEVYASPYQQHFPAFRDDSCEKCVLQDAAYLLVTVTGVLPGQPPEKAGQGTRGTCHWSYQAVSRAAAREWAGDRLLRNRTYHPGWR